MILCVCHRWCAHKIDDGTNGDWRSARQETVAESQREKVTLAAGGSESEAWLFVSFFMSVFSDGFADGAFGANFSPSLSQMASTTFLPETAFENSAPADVAPVPTR